MPTKRTVKARQAPKKNRFKKGSGGFSVKSVGTSRSLQTEKNKKQKFRSIHESKTLHEDEYGTGAHRRVTTQKNNKQKYRAVYKDTDNKGKATTTVEKGRKQKLYTGKKAVRKAKKKNKQINRIVKRTNKKMNRQAKKIKK